MLSDFTHAPHYAAFNCIDHLWSLLSNKLSGVVFFNTASGDSKPPNQLSSPENEIKEKEKKLIMPCYQWKTDIGQTLLLMVFL